MIIDCHTHLNSYEEADGTDLAGCLAKLQASMRRNRVDVAMVLTSYKVTAARPSTRAVVDATTDIPNIHVIAGLSYATFSDTDVAELRAMLEAREIKGLKIYPGYEPFYPADPKFAPAYQLAEEFDVPVMIHCGDTYAPQGRVKYSHPINVDDVAVDFPKVRFLICHLGNPWFRDCMEVVYKNANVYTDISGLTLGNFSDRFEAYMRNQLKEMILWGVNPKKVLWGTDWPLVTMESYLQFMDELRLPPKDKELMMWRNAAEFFRLDLAAPTARGLGRLLG